jgi:putative ABC transport system permease protein
MFVRFKPGVDPQAAVIEVQDQLAEDDIKVDYGASTQNVMTRLKSEFEAHGIRVGSMLTQAEERKLSDSGNASTLGMILALAIIVAIVGGIGLMGALSISVIERTKEIGVLRAVGARSGTIMGMFVMEGILQGVFSWIISVPISFVLGQYVARTMGQAMFNASLDYAYNTAAVLQWLVVILIISILASILPARNATRISVQTSLAYV